MLYPLLRFAVRVLPTRPATNLTIALANRSIRPLPQPAESALMKQAVRVAFGNQQNLVAWSWGEGPKVVLVHGWGGRATQMAPLAQSLATCGFQVFVPEITGHGNSPGHSTSWRSFVADIVAFARALNSPIHAYVGHSAGALTAMVARAQGSIQAERYVCVAAPSFPYPPVVAVRRRLNPPQRVIERYERYLAAQLRADWHEMEACWAYRGLGQNLLLVHDRDDRFVEHNEVEKIAAACPGATVLKTTGLGHVRLLSEPQVLHAIERFLRA